MKIRSFSTVAFLCLLALVLSCSNATGPNPSQETGTMSDLSLPNTYDGLQIFSEGMVTNVDVEITDYSATTGLEHSDCLTTIDCAGGTPTLDFYRDENGDVCIGYQYTLCDWEGGQLSQAIALYLPGTTQITGYLMLTTDIDHGFVDPNPGGCYLMTTYITYSIPPQIQGDFTVDWASALNYGPNCPPLVTFCGWPLSQPADPITVHL